MQMRSETTKTGRLGAEGHFSTEFGLAC